MRGKTANWKCSIVVPPNRGFTFFGFSYLRSTAIQKCLSLPQMNY